jgi:glycine/sarcosine/betaine reductase complex component A
MDSESQAAIKKLVDEIGVDNLVVVLGGANPELAEVVTRTMTVGDPSFAGPLAGVSLGLPVYHILEREIKESIPAEVYEKEVGFMEMVIDAEELGRRFKEARRLMDQHS